MKILTSKAELARTIQELRLGNKTVGFVPTMGALHNGHLSLIKIAAELTDIVVVSIFVNPTQFTNPADLDKYPRPLEKDTALLKNSRCSVLFLPEVTEMYAEDENWNIDLGYLETILEGKFRPGHYQGVTQIVKKLLDVTSPDYVFLGQKDFQQVLVLDHMVRTLRVKTELVMCPIVREEGGLALSSRNVHLSPEDRSLALKLSQSLFYAKEHFGNLTIKELKGSAIEILKNAGIIPEYFEICDAKTLMPTGTKETTSIVALVAAQIGTTRLIDNIILK